MTGRHANFSVIGSITGAAVGALTLVRKPMGVSPDVGHRHRADLLQPQQGFAAPYRADLTAAFEGTIHSSNQILPSKAGNVGS